MLTRRLLTRLSGEDDLAVPELTTARDVAIVERIAGDIPWLGSERGWHVQFGRELNATDDRGAFAPYSGSAWARPVLEGKQIEPFRVFPDRSRFELSSGSATSARVPRRARLAYRDVASATNRLTLIAAIVPARCVTTHTLFCLKTALTVDAQHVLCALLNSFVANYLVRLRVNTHVTASLLSRLPVPVVTANDPAFNQLADLSRTLSTATTPAEDCHEYAAAPSPRRAALPPGLRRLRARSRYVPTDSGGDKVQGSHSLQQPSLTRTTETQRHRGLYVRRTACQLTERIIGCAIEVHRHLGPGLLESDLRNGSLH